MHTLLASLVLLILSTVMVSAEQRVALVIGNGAYAPAPSLPNPESDATAMASALERLGFEVIRGIDLDLAGMRMAIRDFSVAVEGADIALFFYAGHGVQVSGQNYLIPVDADLKRESDLDFGAIDISLVMRQMERAARTKIVLLDACRDNPFETALTRSMGRTRSQKALGRGLAPIDAGGGSLIGFATDPGDVAFDGEGNHSPFTEALLRHLETPNLEVNVLMTRVRADVFETTNQRQRPWTTTSLIGEVYLNADKVEVTVAAPTGQADLELALWQAVSGSNAASDYQAYLDQFPDGTFAGLARNRIAALTPAVPAPDPLSGRTETPATLTAPISPKDDGQTQSAALGAAPSPVTGESGLETPGAPTALPQTLPDPEPEPEPEPQPLADPEPPVEDEDIQLATARMPVPKPARPEPEPIKPPDPSLIHRDCPDCPAMVPVPGGTFTMGSPKNNGWTEEGPAHEVTVAPFLMARTETTMREFRAFVERSGHKVRGGCYLWTRAGKLRQNKSATARTAWKDMPGNGDGLPVACVSWTDAQAFVRWLNQRVPGAPYRLPSEAEFEYVLRAGGDTAYPWGAAKAAACAAGNGADAASRFKWRNKTCDDGHPDIAPAAMYPANPFGLHDLVGNLWEWTADCWNGSHRGATGDARARDTGTCNSRVLRGGSWDDPVKNLRATYRVGIPYLRRQQNVGFRVVRDPVE